MIFEKSEACPRCGADGDDWHYDFQHCFECEFDGMRLRRGTNNETQATDD